MIPTVDGWGIVLAFARNSEIPWTAEVVCQCKSHGQIIYAGIQNHIKPPSYDTDYERRLCSLT